MPHSLALANHVILLFSLAALWMMGLPATWIVVQNLRRGRSALAAEARLLAAPLPPDAELPDVLVQIPTFNEETLVQDVCRGVGALDWPRDRLHVQVLDDSTDGSALIAAAAVAELCEQGIDAVLLHRESRTGYKAGALAAGLARSRQEFVAILDADYRPRADFLRGCLRPLLSDSGIALVQARCDYLNPDRNWLTRVQRRILDAHYGIEQATRSWIGLVLPFNGTCGVWRRAAIEDAGGWQSDTLAEDLDLSYRVQLRGWRAMFLVSVAVPGRLPESFSTWRTQQFRWVKGPSEVARKLARRVWRSKLPLTSKVMSTLQFLGSAFGPVAGVALATGAVEIAWGAEFSRVPTTLLCVALLQAVAATSAMVVLGQMRIRGASIWTALGGLPLVIGLFIGLAVANLRGVIEGFLGRSSAFVRTPKTAEPGSPDAFGDLAD